MRQELKEMLDLLHEHKAVLQQLLELSYEKNQVIIKGDTERLSEITELEQRRVARLKSLERKRGGLFPAIADLLGLPENDFSLSSVLEKVNEQEYQPLYLIHKELVRLLNSQLEVNKLNSELLETQLEYTGNMLGLLVGDEDPLNNFYSGDGRADAEKRKSTGFFDQQI